MSKLCPGCGATTLPEARFCRVCGVLLRRSTESDDGERGVSPGAKTVPLSGEGRPTKGIASDDPQAPVTNTAKVRRAEMDEILRHPRPKEYAPTIVDNVSKHAHDDLHTSKSNSTNELKPLPETPAPVVPQTPAASADGHARTQRGARRRWPIIVLLVAGLAIVAGLIVFLSRRRDEPAVSNANSAPAPPSTANDLKKQVDEKLVEAQTLLAAGQTSEAIALLKSAIELDPTNALAHLRLGQALEKSGERQAAIEEYRISTLNDQSSEESWRVLASAQLAEGLFNDAVESYRRLLALKGEDGIDDETRMDYAQALVLAGRMEEARAVYQRVASSTSQDLADKARRQLAQLPQLPSANANAQPTRDTRNDLPSSNSNSQATQQPQPTPSVQPSPAPTIQPTPATATPKPGDNSAQLDPDVYYERGLKIVGRSDIKTLPRAELLQALEYFQRAQNGTHRAEATRYVQQLGREYDRRKKQSQP